MLWHIRLHEDYRFFRIQSDRQKRNREIQDISRNLFRIPTSGYGMLIYDAPDAVEFILHLNPSAQSAKVIAKMCLA